MLTTNLEEEQGRHTKQMTLGHVKRGGRGPVSKQGIHEIPKSATLAKEGASGVTVGRQYEMDTLAEWIAPTGTTEEGLCFIFDYSR